MDAYGTTQMGAQYTYTLCIICPKYYNFYKVLL